MQCTLFIVSALLGLSSASGSTQTGGQCPGALSDEIHASTPASLLQVQGARAAAMQPNKCDPAAKSSQRASWEKNIQSEVDFWEALIPSKGDDWERLNQSTPIRDAFRPYL